MQSVNQIPETLSESMIDCCGIRWSPDAKSMLGFLCNLLKIDESQQIGNATERLSLIDRVGLDRSRVGNDMTGYLEWCFITCLLPLSSA